MVYRQRGGTIMDLAWFLWTVIAAMLGTIIGIVVLSVVDKAYGIFNG
jgi:predicted DNA repair protein MutK